MSGSLESRMAEVCELLHAHTKYELVPPPPLSQPSIQRATAGKENARDDCRHLCPDRHLA